MKKPNKATKKKSKKSATPRTANKASKPKAKAKATPKAKPKAKAKAKARPKAKAKPAAKSKSKAPAPGTRWVKFVEQHGVVLVSARGPVPSVAEAIAGEPIVGSWWSHPKAQIIFDALSSIDVSGDIRCFKLVDHKVTFVHRRMWPALAKLAEAGVISADRAASIEQVHMPSGEHRNITTAYPDWVPEDIAAAAAALSIDDARAQLGSWV